MMLIRKKTSEVVVSRWSRGASVLAFCGSRRKQRGARETKRLFLNEQCAPSMQRGRPRAARLGKTQHEAALEEQLGELTVDVLPARLVKRRPRASETEAPAQQALSKVVRGAAPHVVQKVVQPERELVEQPLPEAQPLLRTGT